MTVGGAAKDVDTPAAGLVPTTAQNLCGALVYLGQNFTTTAPAHLYTLICTLLVAARGAMDATITKAVKG